jgi:transcription antitermination factor NusG
MTLPDLNKKWYVLYTNPRAEKKVAGSLSDKGYLVYLPLQTTIKQWSDRKKKVEEPLFKSYLFIYANHEQDHIDILQVQGVMKFVRIGKETITVRQQQIDAIKLLLATGSDIEVTDANYDIGDAVEIFAGPLKGLNGHIVKQIGSRNFSVSLEQLGASLLITVPVNYLREQ